MCVSVLVHVASLGHFPVETQTLPGPEVLMGEGRGEEGGTANEAEAYF